VVRFLLPSAAISANLLLVVTSCDRHPLNASAPCLLAVCSNVAVPPVIRRH
jgi:hypothetical protein